MKRQFGGMIKLGCFTLVVIVFIKCSLAVTFNDLEADPEINLIADEVKEQLVKTKKKPGRPCEGPPTTGKCMAGISGFTFDPDSNSCKKFNGGGCSVTKNGFHKKEDCEAICKQKEISLLGGARPALCNLNKDEGLLELVLPRFFFNKKTGLCEKFIFGGGRGNKNNFKTIADCEKTCVNKGFSGKY